MYLDMLIGAYDSYEDVERRAKEVGAAVSGRAGLILVPSHRRGSAALPAVVRRDAPKVVVVPMTSTASPHVALIVPEEEWAHTKKRISEAAEFHRVVAISVGVLDVPTELHERHLEAASLLAVAPAASDDSWLIPATDLVHRYVVAHARGPVPAMIQRRVLEPLRQNPKLFDALDAYFRSTGSPKAAGRLLGVSETTARAHRTKIETMTGLLFDRPADVVWLGYAWALERDRKLAPS